MKYLVKIKRALCFESLEAAAAVLQAAGEGATVVVVPDDYQDRPRRGRQPKAAAAVSATGKRRGRPPKVRPEADAEAGAEGPVDIEEEAEEEETAPAATPVAEPAKVDRKRVQTRFAALVETDYEAAAALLEKFGVPSFSALPDEVLAEFDARI